MARWSNNLTACINLCSLMLGLSILTVAITMHERPVSSCHKLLILPCARLGSVLAVVSLFGLLGSCCRSPFLLWIYLFFYIIVIFVMIVGIVLWAVITIKGSVRLDVGQEYRMAEFASWFKDHVFGMTDWSEIRQCMMDRDLCLMDSSVQHKFYSIPQLQHSCCKLPKWCLTDKNNASIPDCKTWKNEPDKMCYYCNACTGGFLQQLSQLWQKLFPGYVALFVLVMVVFVLGSRAFQQHKADHYQKVFYATKA
ncbi:hypothetical protein RND81_03G175300 [Saponaria officinalis]|uniref:Uncharacterized protein n=1 Tax=Saponaria officinalis TaxID=3572 RepID=A0AAW1M904_SAPOF